VVEDNPTNLRIIRHRAAQWGMRVQGAASSGEALKCLADDRAFDVAIFDLQLPGVDGLTLAETVRQQPTAQALPLLLLSSVRLRGDDARAASVGVAGLVHKPIRPAQLLDAVCRALGVKSQQEKKAPSAPALDGALAKRIPLRVLLADDNTINQKVGQSILKKFGYRADLASNGIEVLGALEQRAYDIVFLDVQMPELDGLETARQISKRWPREKRPCIIAMTGNALMGDREKCLEAGMDDYITKPVRIGELQQAIERWGPARARKADTSFLRRNAPPVEELLDESILAELREVPPEDGVSMVRELVDLFLESAPQTIAQINDSTNDASKMALHTHTLKSMSLNLGAKRVVELSQKLEALIRDGKAGEAAGLLAELNTAFDQTKVHLLRLREQ